MKCPYCSAAQGRCATTSTGRSITECTSCGRVVEERQFQNHHLFHVRAQDTPLCLVTSDIPAPASAYQIDEDDPFEPTGFITAFSTWSLEPNPLFLRSSLSFSGHLAELERILELSSSSAPSATSSSTVVVDNLRAYMQILDVASILGLDCDISDHAFQLFRDCCSATCLRNRSVEALATAALVQAIREAQEPRTLQEISIAANVPQKEIGKYIKILGEALQLSQPINSNSISVHMPRFCTLLQLNKSAQELATHIGEVVINKCFCTRRNPISISAAAIYLACQLEDKRKTQAEICKVTGLTEVTLRKVYKELLENWDDLLPSNYTPAVPPEKAFPTTTIATGRSSVPRVDSIDLSSTADRDKQQDSKPIKPNDVSEAGLQARGKDDAENNGNSSGTHAAMLNRPPHFRQPWLQFGAPNVRTVGDKNQTTIGGDISEAQPSCPESEQKVDMPKIDTKGASSSLRPSQFSSSPAANVSTITWPFRSPVSSGPSPNMPIVHPPKLPPGFAELKGSGTQNGSKVTNPSGDSK
ncbi:hypothetical protein ERO13_D11G191800v2 [Gossypium hirsutum]|uniref:Plant-specific TFIIB-related protein 1 isoform X1 n=1 Tax=Gossypium hirsutum TaxID=3635 RepID=A0A1U8K371_GOSHI|nr:plant-specific TFIIB-related protein 1 isoform X1 [Gossypium hirsutum]KAG4121209.1 hypothetical protein ERO13_D11G191800v2 [Gossypium hirsutum]